MHDARFRLPCKGPEGSDSRGQSSDTADGVTSIRTLYLLSAAVMVAMIGLGIIWPLIPVYARELGATGFQLGLIIASFPLARTLFNSPIGRFSDLRGRKPLLLIGLLAYAAVSLLYVWASRVEALLVVRFLQGLASVLVVPIAMALAGDIAPRDRLGLYMGTLNMAVMLGLGVGPMLGGAIRDAFGMNAAFYAMGALTLITYVGVKVFIPDDPDRGAREKGRHVVPFRVLLTHRVLRGLLLLRFFNAGGYGCVYTFLPLLALSLHLTSSQVGLILGANILLSAFLQRWFGALSDRVDPVRQIVWGALLAGLPILAMPLAEGFWGLLALNVLMGLGGGVAMPAGLTLSARIGRTMGMGAVIGLLETSFGLGMIASPILSGIVMDLAGLPSIFIIGGSLVVLGTALMFLYLRGYEEGSL